MQTELVPGIKSQSAFRARLVVAQLGALRLSLLENFVIDRNFHVLAVGVAKRVDTHPSARLGFWVPVGTLGTIHYAVQWRHLLMSITCLHRLLLPQFQTRRLRYESHRRARFNQRATSIQVVSCVRGT